MRGATQPEDRVKSMLDDASPLFINVAGNLGMFKRKNVMGIKKVFQ